MVMSLREQLCPRTIYYVRFLPFGAKLPSANDGTFMFIAKTVPYVVTGVIAGWCVLQIPGAKPYGSTTGETLWGNWILFEDSLLQWIYALLILASGWGLAYSMGLGSVMMYRKFIGRPLGNLVAKWCKDRIIVRSWTGRRNNSAVL